MSYDLQLFQIWPMTEEDRRNDVSLKDYKYLQFMGYNKNAAILCSLIHFALNRKQPKILQDLIELITSSQNQSKYQEIVNLIKQTKDLMNPIQIFFKKLYQLDQKNEITEQLLIEFCQKKRLFQGQEISYDKMAAQLKMRISFNNVIYGRDNKDFIDLKVTPRQKYFYLIPEPLIFNIPTKYCRQCSTKTELITLECKHQHCYKCIKQSSRTYSCCSIICTKPFLKNFMDELLKLIEYNQRSNELQQYYESTKQQISYKLENQDNNNQLQITTINDPLQECNICLKKFRYQLFIMKICKHKYCYDCINKNKLIKYCLVSVCTQKIDQQEVQNYLIKTKNENNEQENIKQNQIQQYQQTSIQELESRIMDQCQKCNTIQVYKLFQVKICNHKLCNQCLSKTNFRYQTLKCLVNNCYEKFTSQEYQIYIKQLQDLSRSEQYHTQNNISQQKLEYFKCEDCFTNAVEDQKYILNCGHSVCYQCIIKDSFYSNCCIQSSKDQEYLKFRNNITTNCKGCQNNFPLKNLYLLKCKHEFCLSCCQKVNSKIPNQCLDCSTKIYFTNGLNKFITDQIIEQKKQIASKEESHKIENFKVEEPQIDKKLEYQINNNQVNHIINHEEEKIIEQNTVDSFVQQDNNKTEEEKSLSVKNSTTNLFENSSNKKENSKQKEEFQIQQQKDIISTNRFIIQNQNQKIQIQQQPIQQAKQDFQTDLEDIILYQQIDEFKLLDQQESQFYNGFCTNCQQQFSYYNRKQEINCKTHEIGVCCILTKYKNCPQCEQSTSKKIQIKQNLILPTNPVEIEFIFENTLPKTTQSNYYQQPYQQTSISQKFQNIDRLRQNEGSAVKRNVTTDTIQKRVYENQKQLNDKYNLRNDMTLQKYQPQSQQSYYPQKQNCIIYEKLDQDYRLGINNNNYSQNFRNFTHHSNRLV
ncbi:unnamed protein product [Paramecium pentaurelia]|uniref:RING-type domain-containing protein n=1 Tax=Paramecium pentaurelia TaxID=43138 RepID=A0A8S1YFV1_9CILI|nr:unnamed protein product [Paramecium pentaurelia]